MKKMSLFHWKGNEISTDPFPNKAFFFSFLFFLLHSLHLFHLFFLLSLFIFYFLLLFLFFSFPLLLLSFPTSCSPQTQTNPASNQSPLPTPRTGFTLNQSCWRVAKGGVMLMLGSERRESCTQPSSCCCSRETEMGKVARYVFVRGEREVVVKENFSKTSCVPWSRSF